MIYIYIYGIIWIFVDTTQHWTAGTTFRCAAHKRTRSCSHAPSCTHLGTQVGRGEQGTSLIHSLTINALGSIKYVFDKLPPTLAAGGGLLKILHDIAQRPVNLLAPNFHVAICEPQGHGQSMVVIKIESFTKYGSGLRNNWSSLYRISAQSKGNPSSIYRIRNTAHVLCMFPLFLEGCSVHLDPLKFPRDS